jgi:hypothetical protein
MSPVFSGCRLAFFKRFNFRSFAYRAYLFSLSENHQEVYNTLMNLEQGKRIQFGGIRDSSA